MHAGVSNYKKYFNTTIHANISKQATKTCTDLKLKMKCLQVFARQPPNTVRPPREYSAFAVTKGKHTYYLQSVEFISCTILAIVMNCNKSHGSCDTCHRN